jgi:hypothetical protein|tara:strand:- start:1330 stop:1524 length:195 start_codon:yes stop_codon:yes gene_type:complete
MKYITVRKENKFGRDNYYPACTDSKMLCILLGSKTLSEDKLDILAAHGIYIKNAALEFKWASGE